MPQASDGKRPLNEREMVVLNERLKGRSMSASMRKAGYADSTIKSGTTRMKAILREPFGEAMERKGFTADKFLDKLERMLECRKWQPGAPEPQPDNVTQMYALRLWADLAGYEPPKKTISDVNLSIDDRRAEQRQIWSRLGGLS